MSATKWMEKWLKSPEATEEACLETQANLRKLYEQERNPLKRSSYGQQLAMVAKKLQSFGK